MDDHLGIQWGGRRGTVLDEGPQAFHAGCIDLDTAARQFVTKIVY